MHKISHQSLFLVCFSPSSAYSGTTSIASDLDQLECLALNIYHEARSESTLGKRAVAYVVLNRVMHDQYPDTPCSVVRQATEASNGSPLRHQCQFSWYCDGRSDEPSDQDAWIDSIKIAAEVITEYTTLADPTEGALMYHSTSVNPNWVDSFDRVVQIDNHIFYR
jgi:N-acetylmuramoyl-L-alanine amidase